MREVKRKKLLPFLCGAGSKRGSKTKTYPAFLTTIIPQQFTRNDRDTLRVLNVFHSVENGTKFLSGTLNDGQQ
jgi:hypothetical protein